MKEFSLLIIFQLAGPDICSFYLEFLILQYYVAYRNHTKINCFKTYKEWTVF